MQRLAFTAMGTNVEIFHEATGGTARRALAGAPERFEALEQAFSRFRPDSELSRVNRDRHREVSPEFLRVVELAIAGCAATSGRYDPTVGNAVVAAGYSTQFDDLPAVPAEGPARPSASPAAVVVDHGAHTVTLRDGVLLDLGGIVKGYAAQVVADELGEHGPALVNAGGDIAVHGVPVTGDWTIGVELDGGRSVTLGLTAGAVATSGVDRRRWVTASGPAHHVIDPTTGRPVATDIVRVTVVAPTAPMAEVAATALLVHGSEHLHRGAKQLGVDAIAVLNVGAVVATEALQ